MSEAAALRLPIMLEPFMSSWRRKVVNDLTADAVITSMAIAAAGLGESSAYSWLKIPVVDDMERVMAATTLPTLLLGGDPSGSPEATYRTWADALALPACVDSSSDGPCSTRPDGDVAAAVDVAADSSTARTRRQASPSPSVHSLEARVGSSTDPRDRDTRLADATTMDSHPGRKQRMTTTEQTTPNGRALDRRRARRLRVRQHRSRVRPGAGCRDQAGRPGRRVRDPGRDREREGCVPAWSNLSLSKRQQILFAFREVLNRDKAELAEIITSEHGKVIDDALGEIARGQEVVELATNIPSLMKGEFLRPGVDGIDVYSIRQPLGVVGIISPFNFPAMVPLWFLPIAIAAGNTVVLKPSEKDPGRDLAGVEVQEAGLPDGVFNVLNGDKLSVDGLLTSPDVESISFVGSTPIAQYVYETGTKHGKRVQALGGAKNHMLVLPDADLDLVADNAINAGFGSAGERCMAISVVVAVEPVADELIEKITERAATLRIGDGRRGCDMARSSRSSTATRSPRTSRSQSRTVRWLWWTAAPSDPTATRTASGSARRSSTGCRRRAASTRRRSSARC